MRPLTRIVIIGTFFVVACMTALRWAHGTVAVMAFLVGLLALWVGLELVVRFRERRSSRDAALRSTNPPDEDV